MLQVSKVPKMDSFQLWGSERAIEFEKRRPRFPCNSQSSQSLLEKRSNQKIPLSGSLGLAWIFVLTEDTEQFQMTIDEAGIY